MVDIAELKNEIDNNGNKNEKIDNNEILDFLSSEENIKKLSEALDSSENLQLAKEFREAIWISCHKITTSKILGVFTKEKDFKNISLNEFNMLLFFCKKWYSSQVINNDDFREIKDLHQNVSRIVCTRLVNYKQRKYEYDEWLKNAKDKEEYKKQHYKDLGPFPEYYDKIEQERKEKLEQRFAEHTIESNGMDILRDNQKQKYEEKYWKKRENDKVKILSIIEKEWDLTNEDKSELIRLRNQYYIFHFAYRNPEIKTDTNGDEDNPNENPFLSIYFPYEEYDKIAKQIEEKLNANDFQLIRNIIKNNKLPNNIKQLSQINERFKKYWLSFRKENNDIEQIIKNEINNISNTILNNADNHKNLTTVQIWIFQLRANIQYWENLTINGNKWKTTFGENKNEELTNLYIYRQEIKSRKSKRYKNILTIPNLDDLLQRLWSNETQNQIFKDFLTFFFNIQKSGLMFEDKIGSNIFESLLENMISSDIYKWKSVESEIIRREYIKTYAEMAWCEEIISQSEENINCLKQIRSTEDLGNYYENVYRQQEASIQKQHDINLKEEKDRRKREEINNTINKIGKDYNNIQKYKEDRRKYRNKFKPIAQNFINSRKNNKSLYSESILPSQIFTEIYCLWWEDTKSVFSPSILQECKKYKSQLDYIAESENKHIERVVDTYHLVTDITEMIEKGELQICEEHYDDPNTRQRTKYIPPQNVCVSESTNVVYHDPLSWRTINRQPEQVRARNWHTVKISEIVHIDTYKVPWSYEKYETVVELKDSDGNVIRYHGYWTKDYNPGTRLVQPDPNWWYAIIPDRLKSKANQWKIKFWVINDVAYLYEFERWGDIKMYEFNKKTKKFSKTPKIITQGEYTKALTIESNRFAFREAEHGEEYKRIQNEFKTIIEKSDDLQVFIELRQNENLNKISLHALQDWAIRLYNLTERFANNRDKLIQMKNSLIKLNKNTNNYENPYEKQIRESIETIDQILSFATQDQVRQAAEFRDFCLNRVDNNDTFLARRKDWLPSALAFVAAIAITIASFWTLSELWVVWYLAIAWISTAGTIVVDQGARIILNKTTWYGNVTVDGVTYQTHYENPTLIEHAYNGEISWGDVMYAYWKQRAAWTLLQFVLMEWWAIASKRIWSWVAKAPVWSPIRKAADFLCTLLTKEKVSWDAFTEWVLNSIEKEVTKESFIKRFWEELLGETREESIETLAERKWAILWAIATIIHCLKPNPGQALEIASIWNPNIEIIGPKHEGKLFIETTYDCGNTNNLTVLKNYYESIPWYNVSIQEWEVLKVTAKWITTWKWETVIQKDIELKFCPSKAPIEVRSIPSELTTLWWVNINHETGEVTYSSEEQLAALWEYYEAKWLWIIKINLNWTATLTIGKNTVNIKKWSINWETTNIESLSTNTPSPNAVKIDGEKIWKVFERLLNWEWESLLKDLSANDLRLLMFKACNMWLPPQTILQLWVAIDHGLMNNTNINPETKAELKSYVDYLCYVTEINNVNINEDVSKIETALDGILQQIETNFWKDSTMATELSIEINKKKFELYKKTWDFEKAKTEIDEIQEKNSRLLSNDVNNFKYRRWILESKLLEIQLWWDKWKTALEDLASHAQKLREKTETIWWRTDTETLISKIEAWILLWKSKADLEPYLDFLALTEHWAWINILWAVIQTINTTFDSDWAKGVLEKYANDVTNAWEKSKDSHLLEAWKKAKDISEAYNKMKNDLDNDSNRIHHNEIQSRLEEFVKGREVSSISDVWNDFSHFTILLNPQATKNSPVMSIEIWKADYEMAYNKLKAEFQKEWIDIEWDIGDFNTFIWKFNKVVDNRIRTTFWTENLQELNASEHRALFDYIAAKYMEWRRWDQNASLTNLSQLFAVKWLQDCRLHAFTKQLFFDSWKTNKLNSLENSKTGKSEVEIAEINKQIKIIENTKMVFMDAQFSWNVDMNTIYVARTEEWHMTKWSQNNVIEEHTFNLIEMPILDAEWNIQYDKNWDIIKKVCYADSFYHWNNGKVYDLSYTWENISNTIYWKKWEDVFMTTTVIGTDWKPIQINIKPLSRSIKWRWDNITWTSIETRWPNAEEVTDLNNQYDAWLKKVEILSRNRAEIQTNLNNILEILKSGQKVQSTDIKKALTSTDWHKITAWQANQITRAFKLIEKVPIEQKGKALLALQTMIWNIVTQNDIDFASWENIGIDKNWNIIKIKLDGKHRNATKFLQSEGAFFDAMQVFNETFKENINNALDNLNPKNIESIQNLMDAIIEYQIIYEEDMQSFFERSQQTMLDDGKRWEEYHRNNFEHIAKRFQADMETYSKAVKSLENLWLFEQAYEIRTYMVDQETSLLDHCDKLLWHMIDFKKIKKEMKWIEWREVYIQLKEIQAKWIWNVEAELKKRWMNPSKIKEMVWIDADKPFNSEILSEAISNIEESWLKEYYDTIALVFNPEILAINMENAVYSKWWYKINESYNSETKEEYIARKYAESEISKSINNNTKSWEIGQIISNEILSKINPSLLTDKVKSNIQTEIQHLTNLCSECWIKWQDAYTLCKTATEALVFQTVESQTRIMGDHWINHISWNIAKLNTYLEAWVKGWKIPQSEIWKYKLMWALTHIFHDIWYAATISKWSGSFDGSAIHPFTSKAFFETIVDIKNEEWESILSKSGINTVSITKAIEAHDGTRLDFSTPETTFLSMVNLSDNMGLWVDKMSQIWSNPKLLNYIATLYALDATWIDLKQSNKVIAESIRKDNSITPAEQESLISAITELSGRWLDNIDFWSVSPLTTMEFNWNIPTLSMYKWTNLMLIAEVCWIQIETKYDAEWNKIIWLQEAIETKNKARIMELIDWTKFCSQIVKPLWDYADNYELMDSKWHKYQKTNWKYNMDEIKADLLLWNTVSLNDWKWTVLEYKYEEKTNESILAEKNSVYGHIDTAEMLWKWVDAMKRLNTSDAIKQLGSINKATEEILDNIKNNKSIDTEKSIESVKEAIDHLDMSITSESITVSEDFTSRFEALKREIGLFEEYLNENNYKELKLATEVIQEEIWILSSFLIRE